MAAKKSCQPTRLQRRAPTSIRITAPARTWNVAIPLLSPLATSPAAHHDGQVAEIASSSSSSSWESREDEMMRKRRIITSSCDDEKKKKNDKKGEEELCEQAKGAFLMKKWQRLAAPFRHEQQRQAPSLIPVLIDNC
uniref:Uncharacterized protein n=1 Tax=Kalanchoe fedtschenkoi TaxID=63787 RepID=A0A7N1A061_KALFE